MAFNKKKKIVNLAPDGTPLDENGVPLPPPVPGSGASLPKRPKELAKARDDLSAVISQRHPGSFFNVASGYGLGDEDRKTSAWRLYVFTNDVEVIKNIPRNFGEFSVLTRDIPIALSAPAWGRRNKDLKQ